MHDRVRELYEAFHQVRYTEEAIEAAVYQSNRYIPDRFLPDKAIDVIDEAGARVKLRARRDAPPRDNFYEERERGTGGFYRPALSSSPLAEEEDLIMVEVTKDDI